ncbi:WD repeat-containing protein 65 [Melipona quadrifasciata]|uniref:WD repeat-containing protein 65 n=1 Tax=Melipona quadrifasciata TaxID=166423 RepID=A0A0M8ZU41_9HYME|nr:WD repeat-containing protein 65 [Melipona quadrifasciata]
MVVHLQSRVFYGLKTDISSNAHYISDSEILYPVGNVIALHNVPQYRQRFIRLSEKQQINIISVTHNKKYVAICDIGEKPTISIYDIDTLKRRKLLGIPYDAPDVTRFTCIEFTFDNKHLAAVTGEPDQTMLFYNWEKGKVESSIKVGIPQNPSAIVEVLACNPSDAGVLALGGLYTFKFLTLSDTIWRPYGFSKADNILTCSMTWLNSDRLLLGTKDGKILYLENGDLKNIYKMTDTVFMNLKIREEYVIQATSSVITMDAKEDILWENNVRCLIAFQRGFAYAFGSRTIIVFEKEGPHKYTKRNIYIIPTQISKQENEDLYQVNSMNVNLSSDRLLITTGWPQLFYAKLWGPDLNVDPEPQELKIMGQAWHFGPISDLSVCAWKSTFMTCGELDHSVRLWDFESERLILHKQYTEDICGIALHPTGLFCLIGFSDKLRFMSILIDDLLPMEEFSIRCCKTWDMTTGRRSAEIILKGIVLHDIALSADEQITYCIADDNNIYEIKDNTTETEDNLTRQHSFPDANMYSIVLGEKDQALFLVCPGGIILSVKCPFQEPIHYVTFHIHSADITKIALSYNEQFLISTGMDGSLCIWKLIYPEGKGKIGKELTYTNEVLINKDDLQEKIQTIIDLNVRMRELETEHAYKIRQIEVVHNDKVRDIHQGYFEAIEELRDKISRLQEDHKNELNTINVEILKMKEKHEETMNQMETNYNAKLIVEYDRYLALENTMNNVRQNYEKRLEEVEKHGIEKLQEAVTKYEAFLHEKKLQLEENQDEMTQQARVYEEMMTQVEDDADKEILELKTNYETLLHKKKEANIRLKGEAGTLRNRYMTSLKDVEDLKRQLQRVQSEYGYFQKTIQELEKDKEDLKNEINERDITIQDRERQIYELKRTNQELEKFKFVLNYKITELKNQIEPRDQEIKELKEKIRDMEIELVNLHKTTISLELQLHELREKLRAARRELEYEIHRNKRCQQLLKRIRVDLLDASGLVKEPQALKAAVTKLYHKYSSSDEFLRSRKADLDAQCEFIKQRDHLERTIASLKRQVFQDKADNGKDIDKTVEENIILITELNALREELKDARKHIQHMESLLGLAAKDIKPSEAKKKMEEVCYGHEQLRTEYRSQMQECQNIIIALKDDMYKLISKLPCEEPETKITF